MRSARWPCALLLSVSAAGSGQTGTIDLGETRLHYEVTGQGRAVVFIHGFALSTREWDDQIAALASQYRVVAYDRRGYGKSTGIGDATADPGDLRDLLDSLGIRAATLVGHSAGGDVALRFAIAFPDRVEALVLYPGPPLSDFPIPLVGPPPMADFKRIARQYGLDSMWKFQAALPMFWNPPDRPDIAKRIQAIISGYSGRDILEDHPPSGRFPAPPYEQVVRLPVPTLFITGEREWSYLQMASDSLARWMPRARKTVIPGGAHGVHFAEPKRFNDAVVAFLRSLSPAPAKPR